MKHDVVEAEDVFYCILFYSTLFAFRNIRRKQKISFLKLNFHALRLICKPISKRRRFIIESVGGNY